MATAQEIVDDRRRDDTHPKQVNMTHALCAMKDGWFVCWPAPILWSCCVA